MILTTSFETSTTLLTHKKRKEVRLRKQVEIKSFAKELINQVAVTLALGAGAMA